MANFFDQFDGPAKGNFFDKFDASAEPMDAARATLAQGLREGKRGDLDTYRAAAFRTNQGVPAAGATDAAISGATGGFADEASAAARAPIDMLRRGESFDEAYQHNLAAERDRLAEYRKASPIASTAAEVAGAIAMPLGKGGAVAQGFKGGAVYGAGSSEGDLTQRAGDAAVGGIIGGVAGKAVDAAGRAIAGRAPSAAPSINELRQEASRGYNSPAVKELELAPKAVSDAAVGIRARLDAEGFDEIIGTKAHAILKRLETVPEGATAVSGQNLRSIQKTLGKAAGSIDPQEKAAATMALREFNDFLENVPAGSVLRGSADDFTSIVKEANANYSAAKTAESIDKKVIQAETRAAAANSGMNVANTIRQRMADVTLNPKLNRGMRPEEVAMADRIARGTPTENLIRKAGNMTGGGGGLGTLASAAAGIGATGGPMGLALPAFGFAMRGIGNRMTLSQAEKLSEAIRSRAPLASATTKFEEKVAQFHQKRDARTASAAALAARNLATNLRGAGFSISTGDLMRSLQAPVASRAEDQ